MIYHEKGENGIVISDTHSGANRSLAPSSFDFKPVDASKRPEEFRDYFFRRANWARFLVEIAKVRRVLGSIDWLVLNGDLVEIGDDEVFEANPFRQAEMAIAIARAVNARTNYVVYGTPYHTGEMPKFEEKIAQSLLGPAMPQRELRLSVNGVLFRFKHKIGRSSVPQGRATPIIKAGMWASQDRQSKLPPPDVEVRSHVHYAVQAAHPGWLGLTTPALEGGTHYGETQCEGIVHYGFTVFAGVKSRAWIKQPCWAWKTWDASYAADNLPIEHLEAMLSYNKEFCNLE